jgi:hypothetical protein
MLHLLPDPPEVFCEDIRLEPAEKLHPPPMSAWTADPKEQTIAHVASGCQFRAIRLDPPRIDGLVPFGREYEIAVRFLSGPIHSAIDLQRLGREGLAWILTYTYESRRR